MLQQEQLIGEQLLYQSSVFGNDFISTTAWTIDTSGPTTGNQKNTPTNSQILFGSGTAGKFILTATHTLNSGQIKKSQIEIIVSSSDVEVVPDTQNETPGILPFDT